MQAAHDNRVVQASEDPGLSLQIPQSGGVCYQVRSYHFDNYGREESLVEACVRLVGKSAAEYRLNLAPGDEFVPRC